MPQVCLILHTLTKASICGWQSQHRSTAAGQIKSELLHNAVQWPFTTASCGLGNEHLQRPMQHRVHLIGLVSPTCSTCP